MDYLLWCLLNPPLWGHTSPMRRQTVEILRCHSCLTVALVVQHWPPHLAPPTLIICHTQQPFLLARRLLLALLQRADSFENSTSHNRLVCTEWNVCDFALCKCSLWNVLQIHLKSVHAITVCELSVSEYNYSGNYFKFLKMYWWMFI